MESLAEDIRHEILALRAMVVGYRQDQEQYTNLIHKHRFSGMAYACEVEIDRLEAMIAKYEAYKKELESSEVCRGD